MHLLGEALRLSPEERAALAGKLIRSLDSQTDNEAETGSSGEIHRRLERLDSGLARAVSWSEARRRILAAAHLVRTPEFLDEALGEAEVASRWYAERSPTAATGFTDELDAAIAEIGRAPMMWPLYEHNTRRFPLRRFPYSIVYRVDATRVVVIAVANAQVQSPSS